MMNKIAFIIFATIILFSGCREDKEEFIPDDNGIIYQSDLIGIVTDDTGAALPTVSINVDGTTTQTDASGVFKLKNVNVKSGRLFVQALKGGYFEGSRTTFPLEDRINFVRIKLLPKVDRGIINGATGGRIDLPGDVRFTFPEEGVINATSGNIHTGNVHVYYQHLDPNNNDLFDLMPGNLQGRRIDGSEQLLTTYGMMAVELTDDNGNLLQVADGKSVIVDAKVPQGLTSSIGSIPLWSFNETSGIWEEESIATISNDMMSGSLSHFSWWNFDLPTEQVLICGHVEYATNGALFTPQSAFIMGCICRADGVDGKPAVCGYTDDNGNFKARVPVGETFDLKFKNECGDIIYTESIGPYTMDSDIGTITIDPPIESYADIQGRLIDCNGDPVTNGYIKIEVGNITQLIETNYDGTFMGRVQICDESTFNFTAVDINNLKQSLTATRPIEQTVDIGDIEVCDELDEYIVVEIEGETITSTTITQAIWNNTTRIESIDSIESGIYISFPGVDVGVYNEASIEGFEYGNNFIRCGNQAGTLSVTVLTYQDVTGYIEGTFTGDMCLNSTGDPTSVTGKFRVIREQ